VLDLDSLGRLLGFDPDSLTTIIRRDWELVYI
jgi:hypothetical protein